VVATLITVEWLNAVQRELVNAIVGAGLTIDPGDDSQLFKAVQAIQAAAFTWAKLSGKPTTISASGITDVFSKTETSTAIQQAVAALVASSPAALDTLKELADALGNDPNFAATVTNALAGKASKSTTLGGYGIGDAYTKTESNGLLNSKLNSSFCASAGFTDGTAAQPVMTHSNGTAVGLARQDAAFAVGQTWQDVKASRAANTNYTNTTGRPIQVNIVTADANARSITVGGVVAAYTFATYGGNYFLTATIPPGSTYSYSGTFSNWAELR